MLWAYGSVGTGNPLVGAEFRAARVSVAQGNPTFWMSSEWLPTHRTCQSLVSRPACDRSAEFFLPALMGRRA